MLFLSGKIVLLKNDYFFIQKFIIQINREKHLNFVVKNWSGPIAH